MRSRNFWKNETAFMYSMIWFIATGEAGGKVALGAEKYLKFVGRN
jgi:hypothetical protein